MGVSHTVRAWTGSRPVEGVDPRDRGLTLGDGLFETVRIREGRAEHLRHHLARLGEGAVSLGIPVPGDLRARVVGTLLEALDEGGVRREPGETGERGEPDDGMLPGDAPTPPDPDDPTLGILRVTLTRGPGEGLAPPSEPDPTLVVSVRPWHPDRLTLEHGVSLIPLPWPWRPGPLTGIKATSWGAHVQAQRWARDQGGDEGLWTDGDGRVVESTTSNLFAVVDGILRTPPLTSGCLPGVVRAEVLARALERGRPVDAETPLTLEELERSTETFLTNSLRGRVGVRRIL